MAGALPVLVDRVASMEGCQSRALTTARRGLDILADQLVALGALSGRSSPNRNPLAGGWLQTRLGQCTCDEDLAAVWSVMKHVPPALLNKHTNFHVASTAHI